MRTGTIADHRAASESHGAGGIVSDLELGSYINGKWEPGSQTDAVGVLDPASGETVVDVPRCTISQARVAIDSARDAFDNGPWPKMSGKERGVVLHRFADNLWKYRDEIVDLVVRQGGCTIRQARGIQVYDPIDRLHAYADAATDSAIDTISVSGSPFRDSRGGPHIGQTIVSREPAGVVAAITAFNYPFYLNIQKVGAALAAGCTVVLKPTDYTCLDAAIIARAAHEDSIFPPGVLNVLMGAGSDVGALLCSDPGVDQVSFTGSTATGRSVMAAAAQTVKRVTLELGGHAPNIIFEDADLDRALAGDGGLAVRHAGQACAVLSRVIVQRAIYDEVLTRMLDRAGSLVVGDPFDPASEMGPLISSGQWERVRHAVERSVETGAKLEIGGDRPSGLPRGNFMSPAVLTNVDPAMDIAQEEVFGPVTLVFPFDSEEEAVELANGTIYGLKGAVWSGDLSRGLRVAGNLRLGGVFVNGSGSSDLTAPHGGFKQSGLGRENGVWGVDEFREVKAIMYNAA